MAVRKVLARGWRFEIENADNATFSQIKGIKSWSQESEKEDADATDFDSDGWAEHVVAQRGKSVGLEGFFLTDPATGVRDAGQARCEALADLVDEAAEADFRFYHVASGKGVQGKVTVDVTGPGGGTSDNTEWGVDFVFNGKPTAYTVAP